MLQIPAHVYQSSFCPNTQWTEEYASGAEIREYWQNVARKFDVYSKLRLSTKVIGSFWDSESARWRLEVEADGKRSIEYFDFVIHAMGRFNSWKMPTYPGMEKYTGGLFHSSNWDSSFDPTGKHVALIGNGASGVQILPALQKISSHIDHYARNPTWIGGAFTPWLRERQDGPMPIREEVRETFQDCDVYMLYRRKLEDGFWRTYQAQIADSEASNALPEKLLGLMKKRLDGDSRSELFEKLVPDFPPHCRRLTPAPGYLESLIQDNVTLVQTSIERFTEDGEC